ncbi:MULTISPECIES: P-type conjugative transfer protein TrbL [unclassified Sphingopyxis]|jgi:type IV secretion system protein TrbL|uniref:P-type conjugative transfer protein TrbL n=1 Tax=unclassified Sphingopyxis TaxID=2614943 RepID=UPI002857A9D2|nr:MULTISPECIES: P-type conjugative transfer protein TrbL [unclassified Sphingopyxis]MDR7059176.1 type IV secretion system protein TrbL [Sphingopyxis sp. BE235]MDR7178638.1 type IV secretion system protein TrbL [Sphingopyxis sp. BE249]
MNSTDIIDRFLQTFSRYIDSGFGLLQGEVAFLSSTLIVLDLTIAGLFWAWGTDEDVMQRLVKKTLTIGTFAFIIGNFQSLATILLESFTGLGLKATGDTMAIGEFLRPGRIGGTGIDVAGQLLDSLDSLTGPIGTLTNLPQIVLLLLSAILIMFAFFIMAIQVFVTVIEFKLVTLAGFVLLPFSFFNRTAFMAERVLGYVMSTGIKLLVLAIVTGIGTTLFQELILDSDLVAGIDLRTSMALVLAALALLGLAIFGPAVANGIVAGGPQLGAGAAVGTALAGGGLVAGGIAGARLAAGTAGGAAMNGGRMAMATAGAGSRAAGTATAAYAAGSFGRSGASAVAGGMAAVGKTALGKAAASSPLRKMADKVGQDLRSNFRAGARSALGAPLEGTASSSAQTSPAGATGPAEPPAWAKAMRQRMSLNAAAHTAAHAVRGSDTHSSGTSVDLSDKS